jgi:hypothetical protein
MPLPRLLLCLLLLATSLQVAAGSPVEDPACSDTCTMEHDTAGLACDDQANCGNHEAHCTGHCMPALSTASTTVHVLETGFDPADPLLPPLDSLPARLLRPPIPA